MLSVLLKLKRGCSAPVCFECLVTSLTPADLSLKPPEMVAKSLQGSELASLSGLTMGGI